MGKTKSKIMFFTGDLSSCGGTQRVLSVIANGLSRRGYPVLIVSLCGQEHSFFKLEEKITIYWARQERNAAGIKGSFCYLAAVLKKERPRFLVDVDTVLGCYSFFLKRLRPEIYWVSWEHFTFCHPFKKNRLLRKLVRRLVVRYADHLVVLTEADKKSYEKKLRPRCLVTRIYNPVSCKDLSLKYRKKPVIFAAGRLVEEKGFDLLIRSWKLLEQRYPQWSVVIAGDGKDRRRLEKMAKAAKLRRLRFTGIVTDIEKYYETAAFFVLPSRYEGFGMTLAEAMSYSSPAVSYACPEGPKEIVADGENGFLVPQGNIKEFARKMGTLMKDDRLRIRMGKKAREDVRRFETELILNEWEKIFAVGSLLHKDMRKKD